MPVIELNHYNLRAPPELLRALRDFYCNVLGLRVGARPQFSTFGYWLYAGDRPILHLSETHKGEERPPHVVGTFDHAAYTCRDIEAMQAKLDALGIDYSISEVSERKQHQIFFADPAGNGIELNFEL